MLPLRRAFLVVQALGVGWVWFRIKYAVRRKSGGLRRASPRATWAEVAGSSGPRVELKARSFTPNPRGNASASVAEADAILAGRFILFSCHEVEAGVQPDWNRNWLRSPSAEDGKPPLRPGLHWSDYGDFSFGDIKGVWELSRFSWAFSLARAYAASHDDRYAEGFWVLFEDWLHHNPPNTGPNWMCGQEATFRLMAATFARFVCASSPATTPARVAAFQRFVVATGRRIAANLDYALSQSNNHGISECVGLITSGLLVPAHRDSDAWKKRGLRKLEKQLEELVYPDGAFSQHSTIYHRVLLDDLLWVASRLRQTGREVPTWLSDAGARAVEFIAALMNPVTGRVPLYGANDGAQILPLAEADFLDFRPVVQAGFRLFHGRRFLPDGPWDEKAEWLTGDGGRRAEGGRGADDGGRMADDGSRADNGGQKDRGRRVGDAGRTTEDGLRPQATGASDPRVQLPASGVRLPTSGFRPPDPSLQFPAPEPVQHFPDAGCFVWSSGEARLFFRCPTQFRHRPSQADLLHVDLEWRGQPMVHDAGTYSYNPDPANSGSPARERRDSDPIDNLPPLTQRATGNGSRRPAFKTGALSMAAVHNTVTFDGEEPMQKAGRFLYLPWPRGSASWDDTREWFRADHDGWRKRGLRHRRSVHAPRADAFTVADELTGVGVHRGRLHWLIADLPHELDLAAGRLTVRTSDGNYAISWHVHGGRATLVRADPESNRGWWAPHYAQAEPALSLAIEFEFTGECRIETRFGPVVGT